MNVSSKVPSEFNGVSLLNYLATRFNYLPETSWQQFLDDGRISCNGHDNDGSIILKQGDTIRCDLPDFEAPVVNLDYTIVHQDEWLLGINKPAGLRVHSRGKFVNANLIYHLRHCHQPRYPEANLIHRLDADTSGLVLLARDKAILADLSRQFAEGSVKKHYLAVVEGCPTPASGSITLPIGPINAGKIPRHGVDLKQGKVTVTHYKCLRKLSAKFSLLELQPKTGRTHQLRVHMAAIGHPIAGDALYTMNDADYLDWRQNPPEHALLMRQALHSHQLKFVHPIQQTICHLSAPLPADIEAFIQAVSDDSQALANPKKPIQAKQQCR